MPSTRSKYPLSSPPQTTKSARSLVCVDLLIIRPPRCHTVVVLVSIHHEIGTQMALTESTARASRKVARKRFPISSYRLLSVCRRIKERHPGVRLNGKPHVKWAVDQIGGSCIVAPSGEIDVAARPRATNRRWRDSTWTCASGSRRRRSFLMCIPSPRRTGGSSSAGARV